MRFNLASSVSVAEGLLQIYPSRQTQRWPLHASSGGGGCNMIPRYCGGLQPDSGGPNRAGNRMQARTVILAGLRRRRCEA